MKNKLFLSLALAAVLSLGDSTGHAVTITFSLNGYGGGNFLSDGSTQFPDGTKVKLGFFHSSGGFQTNTAVQSTWDGLVSGSGTLASKLTTLGANFYTIAETTSLIDPDLGAAFQILYHVDPDAIAGAAPGALVTNGKFETVINTPGIGSGSFDVKGQKAYVWIETADRSQFGLFYSNELFPTVADEDWFVDVTTGSTGVSAIAGAANSVGVSLIPEPSSGLLLGLGLGLLSLARRNPFRQRS